MRKGKPTQQRMRMYFSDFFGVRKIAETVEKLGY